MRYGLILATLVLLASSAMGQSYLLDKGQSGFFVGSGFHRTGEVSGLFLKGGYSALGITDLGVALSYSPYPGGPRSHYYSGWYNARPSIQYSFVTQFFTAHLLRYKIGKTECLLISANESFSLTDDSPSRDSDFFGYMNWGISATARLGPATKSAVILSAGADIVMPLDNHTDGYARGTLIGGLAFGTGGSIAVVTFKTVVDDYQTTHELGVTLNFGRRQKL